MTFSENLKFTLCYQGPSNTVDCDVVNTKDFLYGCFLVVHSGSSDTDLTLSLYECTTAGKSTTQAISKTVPIYIDIDAGTTSDIVSATTAAYSYAIDPATMNAAVVIFEIDPALLTAGYPYVYLADSAGAALNTCTILWIGQPRYCGAVLPTAIV